MQNQLNTSNQVTMISIQYLSKGFERENLFENINLVIHKNDKIALIGSNGSGKTTFLKCLTGKESFQGRIILSDIKISLMEQNQNFDNLDQTFQEYLELKRISLESRKQLLEEQIGNPERYEDEEKFNSLMDEYNLLLADTSISNEELKTKEILERLNIDESLLSKKIKILSGGQKTKLRLAECLSKKADLYLLDEPTNNLDLITREWLEEYVNKNIKSLIVISHDRYFLDKVAEKVWDIENKQFNEWPYKFKEYFEKKKEYIANLERKYKEAMKKRAQLLESAKEKRLWIIKAHGGSKTRSWKAIAERFEREAEELNKTKNPSDFVKDIKIDFKNKDLHNCEIFRLKNLEMKYNSILFQGVNQEIDSGEKICIIGNNGTGKSTLLKLLIKQIKPSKGDIYARKDISVGYFDQELTDVNQEKSIIELFLEETKYDRERLIPILIKYGFDKQKFETKIKKLSGGEMARLNILRIALSKNNVLILDEPTNNLDIYLIESLENALVNYDGTIIFISHDRYFVNKIAKRILEIDNQKIYSFKGNYLDYLENKK